VPQFGPVGSQFVAGALKSALIGAVLAGIAWRRRETNGTKQFVAFVLSQSVWSLSAAVSWLSPAPDGGRLQDPYPRLRGRLR
jgi:hypothetical protein